MAARRHTPPLTRDAADRFAAFMEGPSTPPRAAKKFGRVSRSEGAPRPNAKYDAAQTTDENRNHWSNADGLSASAANSRWVRSQLRKRSRYERANNGYVKGLIRGRTNDTIGTGPRLQLDLPDRYVDADFQRPLATGNGEQTPEELARLVERKWCEWAEAVGLADKLRVMADAEDTDGETFGLFTRNTQLPGVQLDLRVIECDRVTTPGSVAAATAADGIVFDDAGNPVEYHVLRQHPGDLFQFLMTPWEFDRVPAAQVVHLFDQERPEQVRGIPLMTPALPLYAILRRYTLACLGSAELAAMIAGVIEDPNGATDPDEDAPATIEDLDKIPFVRNALLTLTGGKTAKAFKSEQPSPSYREFKSEILTEAGRSAGEMRNTSTGSSAEYNYSSGRLDHLPRQRVVKIRRERWERGVLNRVFRAWLAEALLVAGYLPAGLPPVSEWNWCWQWDGFESIDPVKDATAQQIRKEIGLTTDADELAAVGKDWREHYRQLAREQALRAELGLPSLPASASGAGSLSGPPAKGSATSAVIEEAARA